METISIEDENGKVYEFEKPSFECDLYFANDKKIIGIVNYKKMRVFAATWGTDGTLVHMGLDENIDNCLCDFNLLPIKTKWYKNESNFPAWITRDGIIFEKAYGYEESKFIGDECLYCSVSYRLAKATEVEKIYYEGKDE